jgi:hypothetical protein
MKACHHVTILTFEPAPLLKFLNETLEMPIAQEFVATADSFAALLHVPAAGDVRCWILGEGTAGLIEVCELHESLRGQVEPGVRLLAFAVRDFERVLASADVDEGVRAEPLVDVPSLGLQSIIVNAGGADMEFVRFG